MTNTSTERRVPAHGVMDANAGVDLSAKAFSHDAKAAETILTFRGGVSALPYAYTLIEPPHDAKCDIPDDWTFIVDPGSERGEIAEALFAVHFGWDGEQVHYLIGVTAEDSDERRFVEREEVIRLLGEGMVNDLEDDMDTAANFSDDDLAAKKADDWYSSHRMEAAE